MSEGSEGNTQVQQTVVKVPAEDKIDKYIRYAFQLGFPAVICGFLLYFQFTTGNETIALLKESVHTQRQILLVTEKVDDKMNLFFATRGRKETEEKKEDPK